MKSRKAGTKLCMSALLFLSSFICWKLEHITKAPWVVAIHQRHSSLSQDHQSGWKWWDEGYTGSSKPSPGYKTLVYVQHGCGNTCLGSHIQPQMCKQKRMEMVSWGWFTQDHPHHLHVICYKSLGMGPTWIWHQMFGILGLPQSTDTLGLEWVFWAVSLQSARAPRH